MLKAELHRAIEGIVAGLGSTAAFSVDYPPKDAAGAADYATNAALAAAKDLGASPREVADTIAQQLVAMNLQVVSNVEVAGPGFINITLTPGFFSETIARIVSDGNAWGKNATREGSRIIVEYSQPNPFKPFHIGHLMSTTIGESLSRLVEYSGASLSRFNYHGDIGPHVAKALWGLMKHNLSSADVADIGKAYVLGNAAYEESADAKAEIDAINKRLYAGDAELAPMYQEGRTVTLARFAELYKVLGSTFDHVVFESETGPIGAEIVKGALTKGIFEESDGAVVFRGEKYGLHTRVFITSQQTPTYEAKELGFAKRKHELFPFDQNITVVAVEQDGYFKVVEKAIDELWPKYRGSYTHVPHGMMQLTGGKMSSRKGNVITGESLIEDMTAAARERMKESVAQNPEALASAVGIAGIKYAVLKQNLGKNIIFDPEKSLSLEGDSGPYLQYAYVRTASILRKAHETGIYADAHGPRGDVSELERLLPRFPEVVERAAQELEPHHVVQYLTQLAGAFNSWYASTKVLDGTNKASYKLALVEAVGQTLKNGLYLMGIEAPQEM